MENRIGKKIFDAKFNLYHGSGKKIGRMLGNTQKQLFGETWKTGLGAKWAHREEVGFLGVF
jgi:hypothetical protein